MNGRWDVIPCVSSGKKPNKTKVTNKLEVSFTIFLNIYSECNMEPYLWP